MGYITEQKVRHQRILWMPVTLPHTRLAIPKLTTMNKCWHCRWCNWGMLMQNQGMLPADVAAVDACAEVCGRYSGIYFHGYWHCWWNLLLYIRAPIYHRKLVIHSLIKGGWPWVALSKNQGRPALSNAIGGRRSRLVTKMLLEGWYICRNKVTRKLNRSWQSIK